jgi:Flp pilus assembly protein TadD
MASHTTDAAYTEACALLASGNTCRAIDALTAAVEDEPDEGRLWALLGVAQWSVGAVTDSIASLETALTLVPLEVEGRLALALGYEVIQKRDLAADLCVGIAHEDNLPYRVLEPLSRALGRANEPQLALDVCREASRRRPHDAGPLRGMAFYMARLGKARFGGEGEEVLAVLFRAFHLEPDDFDTRLLLAHRLRDCGRVNEAAYLLATVAIETAACPRCLNAMREIFIDAGDAENAARCISALVSIADGSPSDYPAA